MLMCFSYEVHHENRAVKGDASNRDANEPDERINVGPNKDCWIGS